MSIDLKKILNQLDANSGTALFILLINVIGIFWYNAVHARSTDGGLITYALGVVGSKTAHGIFSKDDKDSNSTDPNAPKQ